MFTDKYWLDIHIPARETERKLHRYPRRVSQLTIGCKDALDMPLVFDQLVGRLLPGPSWGIIFFHSFDAIDRAKITSPAVGEIHGEKVFPGGAETDWRAVASSNNELIAVFPAGADLTKSVQELGARIKAPTLVPIWGGPMGLVGRLADAVGLLVTVDSNNGTVEFMGRDQQVLDLFDPLAMWAKSESN